MDLELSDDEAALKGNVRAVLEGVCPPSVVRTVHDGEGEAGAVWAAMVELGWPALAIDEQHGGLGLGFVELALVAEELGRAAVPGPLLATTTQFVPAIQEMGDDAAAARFLPGVAAGEVTGTLAAGSGTTAHRDGEGWVLDGRQATVVDGTTADEIVVIADDLGFVVPGCAVEATPRLTLDPTMPIADLRLDGVRLDGDRVLAEGSIARVREQAAVAMAAMTVGACRRIFETTLDYAKVREQFDRPIGSFQALKHRLVDMYLAVERANALVYLAALTIAEDTPDRSQVTAAAKAAAGDCQRLVVEDGLQLHGGIGYTWEQDLHFLLKRAKAGDALFGSAVTHRAALGLAARAGAGVKLTFDDGVEVFRAEFRAWLAENAPTAQEMAAEPALGTAHVPGWAREWTRRMFDAGWLVPGWPPERGGRDAGPVETLVYLEELMAAGIPRTTNPQGLGIIAPSLFDYGRRGAAPRLRAAAAAGREGGLPRHERAGGRQRPGRPQHPGRPRRRPLRRQRPEGVDVRRPLRRLLLPVLPDRPAGPEAQGHQRAAGGHGDARHQRAPTAGDHPPRQGRPERGLLRRRRGPRRQPRRPGERGVGDGRRLAGPRAGDGVAALGAGAGERRSPPSRPGADVARRARRRPSRRCWPTASPRPGSTPWRPVPSAIAASPSSYEGGDAPEQALMKAFCSEAHRQAALVGVEVATDHGIDLAEEGHRRELDCSWIEWYFMTFGATISAGSSEIQRNIIAERVLGLPRG